MKKLLFFSVLYPIITAAPFALLIVFYALMYDCPKAEAVKMATDNYMWVFLEVVWGVVVLIMLAADIWREEFK